MKVLVAEDDPIFLSILEAALPQWGYEVVACTDGAQAWQVLQAEDAPQLVLLDWTMPELEGVEVCRRVRQSPGSRLKYLILLTGKNRRDDVVAGLQAGADDYVTKPFDEEELRARLQVGVRVVELQQQLLNAEQLRVLVQTAGAAAHEINQPLSIIMAQVQLMLLRLPADFAHRSRLETIYRAGQRLSQILQKMVAVRQYTTKAYVEGVDIVDFEAAASGDQKQEP